MRWHRRPRRPEPPAADAGAGVTPPIVIGSDDGLALFGSLASAGGHLEEPDVENGVYGPAFDAAGRRVAIVVCEVPNPDSWRWLFSQRPVEVTADLVSPPVPDALAALLRERLPSEDTDLAALLALAVERFGVIR